MNPLALTNMTLMSLLILMVTNIMLLIGMNSGVVSPVKILVSAAGGTKVAYARTVCPGN